MKRQAIDERERVGAEVSRELIALSRETAAAHPDEMDVDDLRQRIAKVDRRLQSIGEPPR